MHGYLATLARDHGAGFVVVGGVEDHVHLLYELSKIKAPMDSVRVLKSESSRFAKQLGNGHRRFAWQRGYALFSVSATHRKPVEDYVRNQEKHHEKTTFKEEYLDFLKRYGIAYDERYLWD